jgi:hypothetical protein
MTEEQDRPTTEDRIAFHRQREQQEQNMADDASEPLVRNTHLELGKQHGERADEIEREGSGERFGQEEVPESNRL